MTLPLYLAMTSAEILHCQELPANAAYMACHFSPYSTGLSNMPDSLPKGCILILNDRMPVSGHDPTLITDQLCQICQTLNVDGLLLDFQRPDEPQSIKIIESILDANPCKTAVSDTYARGMNCPVFLSAPPIHRPLSVHISPWAEREIWLEAALEGCICTVTQNHSQIVNCPVENTPLTCSQLHCHYRTEQLEDRYIFTLARTDKDLLDLLEEAEGLGVARAIGLYQQLKSIFL